MSVFVLVFGTAHAAPARATTLTVSAQADIFLAGLSAVPPMGDSNGGQKGGGVLPPSVKVVGGEVLSVHSEGLVGPSSGATLGPEGGAESYTRINPYGGISGVIDTQTRFFLVGVFLPSTGPPEQPPPSLDFSPSALGHNFASLSPEPGQVFFIGDGLADTGMAASEGVQRFVAPAGAARLYLGFADAPYFQGNPCCYDDNAGQFASTVTVLSRPVALAFKGLQALGASRQPAQSFKAGQAISLTDTWTVRYAKGHPATTITRTIQYYSGHAWKALGRTARYAIRSKNGSNTYTSTLTPDRRYPTQRITDTIAIKSLKKHRSVTVHLHD